MNVAESDAAADTPGEEQPAPRPAKRKPAGKRGQAAVRRATAATAEQEPEVRADPTPEPTPPTVELEGEAAPAPHRRMRARRSVARMPVLVARADIPDDAAGRVEFISFDVPDDDETSILVAGSVTSTPPPAATEVEARGAAAWIAVAALGAALVVVFLVGMAITH